MVPVATVHVCGRPFQSALAVILILLLFLPAIHADLQEGGKGFEVVGEPILVSATSGGKSGNAWSGSPSASADGRFVAFVSRASNLVSDDQNDFCGGYVAASCVDVFVADLVTGGMHRVPSNPKQGNGDSSMPTLSGNGRQLAFWSHASDLVEGDENNAEDLFLYDVQTGQMTRITTPFDADPPGNCSSLCGFPSLDHDGAIIVFDSWAESLVSADGNGWTDVFAFDAASGSLELLSRTPDLEPADGPSWLGHQPSVSADGRRVVFKSQASNLVDVELPNCGSNGPFASGEKCTQVYMHDRGTGRTILLSRAPDGTPGTGPSGSPTIDPSGRFAGFSTHASNLAPGVGRDSTAVVLIEIDSGEQTVVSPVAPKMGESSSPVLSRDASHVVFTSNSPALAWDGSNSVRAWFWNRTSLMAAAVLLSSDGELPPENVGRLAISEDGHVVVGFWMDALLPGDQNDMTDVYAVQSGSETWVDRVEPQESKSTPALSAATIVLIALCLVGQNRWRMWKIVNA